MKPETLKLFKESIGELYKLYDSLITLWNGEYENDAPYPVTIIIKVILYNIAFYNSDCVGYSHERELIKVENNIKNLRAIDEYKNQMYMTHFPFLEVDNLYSGLTMSED